MQWELESAAAIYDLGALHKKLVTERARVAADPGIIAAASRWSLPYFRLPFTSFRVLLRDATQRTVSNAAVGRTYPHAHVYPHLSSLPEPRDESVAARKKTSVDRSERRADTVCGILEAVGCRGVTLKKSVRGWEKKKPR